MGEGRWIFWKECAAYFMAPKDTDWIPMASTGQVELKSRWKVYLTGGEIRIDMR